MADYISTELPGVMIIEPTLFEDGRGYFFESYNRRELEKAVGPVEFVQDNESRSACGVLRGLHYQLPPFAQAKMVRVLRGTILDVAVDIRKGSPRFGRHVGVELSEENRRQLFIPRGFAHGFVVVSSEAVLAYKVDQYYSAEHDRGIRFDDPSLAIDWPLDGRFPVLSDKDSRLPRLEEAELPASWGS